MRKYKDVEKKLEEMFKGKFNEQLESYFCYETYKSLDEETEYSIKVQNLKSQILEMCSKVNSVELLNELELNLILHVLRIQSKLARKTFQQGLRFGKILENNRRINKR